MVWGPLLPSPVIRTRDVVAIQSRQRVRCRCRSRCEYMKQKEVFFQYRESILAPLGFVHHSLDHYSTVPIAEQPPLFSILPNRFLPLWIQRKRARGLAGNRSSPFRLRAPQHHHYTTVTFLFYSNPSLSLLSQLTLWLFKGLGAQARNRFSLLRLWAPQPWPLHHHGKGRTPSVFLLHLILFFHSETDWKKISWPSRESSLAL